MTQTVEIAPKPQTRRHPTEWKRTIVALTFEPGTSVARVARENGINANQVWAWRRLYAQGLVTGDGNPEAMLPVVVTEPTLPTAQTSTASEVSTATDTPAGSSQIQHGKTSIRIEGAPDPAVLRSVLDRICDDRPATKHQDLDRSRRHRYALRLQLVGREGTDGAGERSVLRTCVRVPGQARRLAEVFVLDGGLCLLAKRLEKGRFTWPRADSGVVALTTAQLSLLLEGFDWRQPVEAARPRSAL